MRTLTVQNSNNRSIPLHKELRSAPMPDGPVTLRKVRAVSIPVVMRAKQKYGSVGFVVGLITSLGMENMETFLSLLDKSTDRVAASQNFPVLSATKIIDLKTQRALAQTATQDDWKDHWRRFLLDAQITDLFLTPFYNLSGGALDEKAAALRLGLRIHDLSKEEVLLEVLRDSDEAMRLLPGVDQLLKEQLLV